MTEYLIQLLFAACEKQIFEPDQDELDLLITDFHGWYLSSEWRELYGSPYRWWAGSN